MATATLSSLRTRVRRRADMENSPFVTDAELTQYINDSYAELYDLLVSKFEDYYAAGPTSFTISDGSAEFTLPSDFYKLVGLDYQLSSNEWYPVRRFNFDERNRRRITTRRRGTYPEVQYRIYGSKIIFTPDDAANGTYRYWYIPTYTALSADADTLDGVNGWEEYVVIDAAIKCLTKEESDTTVLQIAKASLVQRIEIMAQNRDVGETDRITDVRSGFDDYDEWFV